MITPEEMRTMAERLELPNGLPLDEAKKVFIVADDLRQAAAMLRSIAAEREADGETVYLRDLDGTGSMHPCSKGDNGAIAYQPKGAA